MRRVACPSGDLTLKLHRLPLHCSSALQNPHLALVSLTPTTPLHCAVRDRTDGTCSAEEAEPIQSRALRLTFGCHFPVSFRNEIARSCVSLCHERRLLQGISGYGTPPLLQASLSYRWGGGEGGGLARGGGGAYFICVRVPCRSHCAQLQHHCPCSVQSGGGQSRKPTTSLQYSRCPVPTSCMTCVWCSGHEGRSRAEEEGGRFHTASRAVISTVPQGLCITKYHPSGVRCRSGQVALGVACPYAIGHAVRVRGAGPGVPTSSLSAVTPSPQRSGSVLEAQGTEGGGGYWEGGVGRPAYAHSSSSRCRCPPTCRTRIGFGCAAPCTPCAPAAQTPPARPPAAAAAGPPKPCPRCAKPWSGAGRRSCTTPAAAPARGSRRRAGGASECDSTSRCCRRAAVGRTQTDSEGLPICSGSECLARDADMTEGTSVLAGEGSSREPQVRWQTRLLVIAKAVGDKFGRLQNRLESG